ncbi:MAG: C25 family cysteine peptidase [Thermodesulfovibrionales bacterium]
MIKKIWSDVRAGSFHAGSVIISLLALLSFAVAGPVYAANCISTGDGTWTGIAWTNCPGGPGAADTVTIRDGDDIVLNTTTTIAGLTVGQGTSGRLTLGNSRTDRTLTITGDVTVSSGATFNTAGNGGNLLNLGGDLTNNGTFDMRTAGTANVTFNGTTSQTISGTGATTDFNLITLNNTGAANDNILEIASTSFTAAASFLRLTRGVLKMSGTYAFSNTFFNSPSYTIPVNSGIWLNNPNVTVTAQGGTVTLNGLMQIDAGTYNVGTAYNHLIQYGNGSVFTMGGGSLNLSGGFSPVVAANTITYTQSGGTFTLATQETNSLTRASFDINNAGSSFTMSGGSIVLQRINDAPSPYYADYRNIAGTVDITGGTLQFGNASTPAGQTFWIGAPGGPANSTPSIVINSTNSPVVRTKVDTTVYGDVTINTGGTLDWNGQDINLSGNWTNNGTFSNTGAAGVGTVTFNGTATQTIGGSSSTTFNNLTASNATSVTLNRTTTVTNALSVTAGTFDQGAANNLTAGSISISSGATYSNTGTGSITLGGNLVNNGTFSLDGGGGGCNAGDTQIALTATGTRTWSGSGAFQLFNVALDDQDASGIGTIAAFGGTDNGGNSGFLFDVCTNAPTAVKLISFDAADHGGKVVIQWRTGHEVNNLGFNLYRQEGGVRHLITPQPVAGSALLAGPGIALSGGKPYTWVDDLSLRPQASSAGTAGYWLEDLDLNGERTLYGPITATEAETPLPAIEQAATLGQLSKLQAVDGDVSLTLQPRLSATPAPRAVTVALSAPLPPQQLQWILAGASAVKIFIQTEGWYRISQPELAAYGFGSVNPANLQLYAGARQIPLKVRPGSSWRLAPQDYIEFYAKGLDTPSTDTQTYWLVAATTRGQRIPLIFGGAPAPQPTGFAFTTEARPRVLYAPALPKNDNGDKFYGPVVWTDPAVVNLEVRHPDTTAAARAVLEVSLQGIMDGEHNVGVMLNGSQIGQVAFSGKAKGKASLQFSQAGALQEGENVLQLQGQAGAMDLSLLDAVRLTYQHAYTADSDSLRFTVNGGGTIVVSGFSSPEIRAVDITDPNYPLELPVKVSAQGTENAVTVSVPMTGVRTLLTFTTPKKPAAMTANDPSTLNAAANRADMLFISTSGLLGALAPLKQLREGRGLSVSLVDIEDIYDEFSFGNKDPRAIQDFLRRTSQGWKKPPRFVLLTGAASVDPRDHLGFGHPDLVPTNLVETAFNETASDDQFADFNNDGLPEMALGRIPADSSAGAAAVVSKIVGYEKQPEDTSWTEKALLVADKGSPDVFDFETASTEVAGLLPAGFALDSVYRRDYAGGAAAGQAILNSINEGALLVNYMGHGSEDTWGGDLFTAASAETLTNGLRLPFFINMTCWNGWFPNLYTVTLAETLLNSAQGGAVAVWASSGLTEPDRQLIMNKELMRLLFDGRELTIGEAAAAAKAAVNNMDVRRTWILFGDPATRLK